MVPCTHAGADHFMTRLAAIAPAYIRIRDRAGRLRPAWVLGGLVAAQWIAVGLFAATVRHNGWLFYQGGDQIWSYTSGYLVAHGHIPPTPVGYNWPLVEAPIAWFSGANLISALPALIILNVVVLLPVALLCVYGIASRIAGRGFGYAAAFLWVFFPYFLIRLWEPHYHAKWTEQFLPQLLGLTALADFPGMVLLLVGAYFCVRTLQSGGWTNGAFAGVFVGLSIATKPSNFLFLAAPVLAFLVARRWRELVPFACALAPAVLILTLWKWRGLGGVPAFNSSGEPVRLAAGAGLPVGGVLSPVHHYLNLDWSHFRDNLLSFREHFYSERLVEWVPIAGTIAVLRRWLAGGVLIGVWLGTYVIAKGTYLAASVESGSFFRFLMPAWPALIVCIACIPLLVPRWGRRFRATPPPPDLPRRRLVVSFAAIALLYGVFPLAVVAAVTPIRAPAPGAYVLNGLLVPQQNSFVLRGEARDGAVRLRWTVPRPSPASVFFVVMRGRGTGTSCAITRGAAECTLAPTGSAVTRATTAVDRPPPGDWTYRVGLAGNWLNDQNFGDVLVVSTPLRVRVR